MATSTRSCAVKKCEISSCAICHCCGNDLCLDHLKEHKDQLNIKLIPFTNQINTCLDTLEHFNPTSSPSFKVLEQWRMAAHATVDLFCERICAELFEQKKNKPLERLRTTKDSIDQLIRKQGATRENIDSLTNDIRLIEQEIDNLQNIQISLRPLVLDQNAILNLNDLKAVRQETNFQIFVELLNGKKAFIAVKPTNTILELKRKIQDKEGISPEQYWLSYMGKILKDERTVADYDIQKQYTIKQNYRIRQNNE